MTDRVRIIHPNGDITVRDYAFSQFCEMTREMTRDQMRAFLKGESHVLAEDTHFARAGSDLKYVQI